jgi:hypothetical protein
MDPFFAINFPGTILAEIRHPLPVLNIGILPHFINDFFAFAGKLS